MLTGIDDNFAALKVRSILSHNSYDTNRLKVEMENNPRFVTLALPLLTALITHKETGVMLVSIPTNLGKYRTRCVKEAYELL